MAHGFEELDRKIRALRLYLEKHAESVEVVRFQEMLDLSWIYHDCALEGVVLTHQEMQDALDGRTVTDTTTAQAYEEVRRLKQAILRVRDLAQDLTCSINLDLLTALYAILEPTEVQQGIPVYRKEIPLHRVYFHEIAAPERIATKLQHVYEKLVEEEAERLHVLRLASHFQHRFLGVFPFTQHSGRIARLLANLMLMRGGGVPTVIHSIDRQRYYESLRGPIHLLVDLVRDSLQTTLEAHERFFRLNLSALARELPQETTSSVTAPRRRVLVTQTTATPKAPVRKK